MECLLNTLANENLEIVYRGAVVVKNLVSCGKEVAEKVLETQLMDCMQAHIFKAKRKCIKKSHFCAIGDSVAGKVVKMLRKFGNCARSARKRARNS